MSNAGSVASRGRGRGRGRVRPSQTLETPNGNSGAVNAAKPNVAVMDQKALCTPASSIPTCNSAYDKLAHKRLDPKCERGGGDAVALAVLNKRHTDPAIRQPGKAQSNWCGGASDVQNAVVSNRKPPRTSYTNSSGSASGETASPTCQDVAGMHPGMLLIRNTIDNSTGQLREDPGTTLATAELTPRMTCPPVVAVQVPNHLQHPRRAGKVHLVATRHDTDDLQPRLLPLAQDICLSMEMPCSITDTEPCWILNNLRTFNRILMRVDIELKEEEPRKLCVCSLNEAVVANSDAIGLFDACILFHLLLKRHKCIQTLHLDKTAVASGYPQILCDALACNRGLRHLAIACWDFLPGTERTLVYSLCKMPALETIDIFKLSVGPSAATRIGDMIARAKCVRNVKFLENDMSPEAGTELMKGLCRNSSLELIWLDDNALGIGGARFLGEYLATSSKLRDLSLSDVPCFDEQQLLFIAEGLKTNFSLEKLKIHGCHVTPAGIDRLAEVLKSNSTLKHLTVSSCNLAQAETKSLAILLEFNAGLLEVDLSDNLISDVGAVRLAQALKFNIHLETLNLEANHINSQGVVSLVEALACNNVLKELRLGCFEAEDEEDERAVTTALNRIAAHGRVRLCYDMLSGVFQLSASLRMNADRITSVHLDASVDVDCNCLKDLFVALASVPCLKSLCIESQTNMDGSAARRFSKLLSTTKTLKHIQINSCNADNVALETVMKGLKKNQSVLHMEMEFSAISSSCTDAFVDMLKGNKTLTHFGYLTTKVSELYVIARELPANRVLTSLKIWERPGFQDVVFEINEILRRNVSYLNRAVEFALDPQKFGIRRRPAEIFEELCDTESFQNHLARVAGPHGASEAMRNARRHITIHLFAIAGVCQVPVTCWPHPKGARQIDCLDMLCWMNIFAHLKVTDIPCSSTES
ncbi:hypothetical protein MTO96_008994 [Rhipicephalus appendiculatus]